MSAAHTHGPVSAGHANRRRLVVVLLLTGSVLLVELIGAWVTGSLALLADAGHMFTDVSGLLLAVLAITFASRPATPRRSFGYYRLEILAATVNAVLLTVVAVGILLEAWQRWQDPAPVAGTAMLGFAVVGLVVNLIGLALLHRGARQSLNVKGAYLEVLGDTFGSVAVIAAAAVIAATGWLRADTLASVLVALMILPRAAALLREAIDVLLQATPTDLDPEEVRRHIVAVPGVVDAHDLHIWTLTSGMPVMSVHVVVTDEVIAAGRGGQVLDQLGACLHEHFDVAHSTFQLEPRGHLDHEPTPHP